MLNYERNFTGEISPFYFSSSINKKNKVHLRIMATDDLESSSDVVWTGPNGGYAQSGFEIFTNPTTGYSQWRENPFLFLTKALGLSNFPIPDITTLNGKRIFYSHVDGDGFNNISYIDYKRKSSEVIYDEIFKQYKIQISVSVIIAEMDTKDYGKKESIKIAQKIFKLPYIEPASHTFTHPLSWNQVPTHEEFKTYRGDEQKYDSKPIVAYPIKNMGLNYEREVKGSI